MSHQPEASVIVPVYNAEPYLAQCLGSIQRQTFQDFEVIIIDDGSTDRSERIYTDFVKMDDRFRVWKQPNGGVGKARRAGLEKARGRYIFWVDADDWAEPDLLDAAIKQFHEKNADICVWGWNSAEEIKKADFREKTLREWQESVLMGRGNTLWLFAAEKSLWKEIVFPENMNAGGEDGMCALELFLRAEKIAVYPAILYHHRNVVPDSVSHRISSHRYLDTMRLWKRRGGGIAERLFPDQVGVCMSGMLASGVKAYCMSLRLKDMDLAEQEEIISLLHWMQNKWIEGRYKEKILKWCILHHIWWVCNLYGRHKCK